MSIKDFETDVLNKQGKIVEIQTSFRIEGRDLDEEKYKILDSLQTIIGGYTIEDLITSRGKRWLKTEFKKMMDKEYNVEIDAIYISKFKVKSKKRGYNKDEIKELIKLLKSSPCFNQKIKKAETKQTIIDY